MIWQLTDRVLDVTGRTLVLGIVNVTPDSFSDGGKYLDPERAIAHGLQLIEAGADLLDIGGESTRPGSLPVSLEEELRRVVPVVAGLAARSKVPLSIDTSKAEVARQGLAAGAHIINDVTGLTGDPDIVAVGRQTGAGVIVMHMQGTPLTMQQAPHYDDVASEVGRYFEARLQALAKEGIANERIALDPGIGFGKTVAHNLELLAKLDRFQSFGRPVCLGVSRKGFFGRLLDRPVEQRLAASLAVSCHAMTRSAVQILRVHDVKETSDAVRILAAVRDRT